MTRCVRIATVAALAGVVAACGKSPEQLPAEQVQKNAQQLAQRAAQMSGNAQEVAKGFEAMARGVANAASAATDAANAKVVDPVDFKRLQALLPGVAGWQKGHPQAERMTSPVSFSYASARYTKGDVEITEKITDSGSNQLLIAPLTMMLAAGYSKESTRGFEKSTTVAGFPAFEKWDKHEKSGDLTVFVNQRFLVELEGTALTDYKDLQAFLARTDLQTLAAEN